MRRSKSTSAPARPRASRADASTYDLRAAGQRWWTPWLLMSPGIVLLAVFFIWPAAIAIQLAFYKYNAITAPVFVGLDNFARMFEDADFHRALLNTCLYLIGMVPFSVIIPLLLAVLLNAKLPFIGAFRAAFFLPYITSMVAVAVAWRLIFNADGVLNWALTSLHLTSQPIQFLLSDNWSLPSIVLVEGWRNVGFFMLLYLAALQGIPQEIYEAARLDGAGPVQVLRSITFPLVMPYTAVALTLGTLDALRIFDSIYVLTGGGPGNSSINLGFLTWQTAFQNHDLGYASAIGIVMVAIMTLLSLLNQRVAASRTT